MEKDEYIKKLERRIHNQRVALRENWMIVEQRAKWRSTPLRSMWFELVKKQAKEIRELRGKIKQYDKMTFSEEILGRDWDTPEEDKAWENL